LVFPPLEAKLKCILIMYWSFCQSIVYCNTM